MNRIEALAFLMKKRGAELGELKRQGKKIVGYFPGGYFPEELAYAAGAVPVALNRGGDHEPIEYVGSYMSRWIYTFGRAHIGYKLLQTEPVYNAIDILVVPITDNHVRIVADAWDVYTDVEVYRFGVPHVKHDASLKYFLEGLHLLKEKLEEFTGNEITDDKLKEAIELSNKERRLLHEISLLRQSDRPPISGKEFAILNHASLSLDKSVVVGILEEILQELKGKEGSEVKGPRFLLMGTTLAHGDYKVLDMIEEVGAIVIEDFGEGIRHYWQTVETDGNMMDALADRYFWRRVPPCWARPGTERQEFVVKLAKDFKVGGVVWYQMMARESEEFESFWYPDVFQKGAGVPMLKLVSDYDSTERGPFSTRIETFVETIRSQQCITQNSSN